MPKQTTGRPNGRPPKVKPGAGQANSQPLESIPEIPDDLNADGAMLWTRLWSSGGELLQDADWFIIRELCQIFEEKEFVRRALTDGSVPRVQKPYANATKVDSHAFVGQLSALRREMNTLISSLGFSPADRARLGAMDAVSEDPHLKKLMDSRMKREAEREAQREANKK